jgi:hypothetical protein
VDLTDYDCTTKSVCKKKFHLLLKMKGIVDKNMTASGEHDNEPFNFIDVAMKKAGGGSTLTKLGCYYFITLCKANPEVNVRFVDTMEKGLMGSTAEKLTDECVNKVASTTIEDANKKRAYGAMMSISANGATIANAMEETNREMKEQNRIAKNSQLEMKEKNRIAKNSQIISLAKHLDNKELLETLLLKLQATVESP